MFKKSIKVYTPNDMGELTKLAIRKKGLKLFISFCDGDSTIAYYTKATAKKLYEDLIYNVRTNYFRAIEI